MTTSHGPAPEQAPVEHQEAVDRGMPLQDARGLPVHQDVHGRRRLQRLQRDGQWRRQQRLTDPVVDADEEHAPEPGRQRRGRAPERQCRCPGQGSLPGAFQSLVPGLHAFGP
jgi:hypothetical protein